MSAARDAILSDIRAQLGRRRLAFPPPAPAVRLRVPEVPVARRIESMVERVNALGGHAIHARSDREAIDYVHRIAAGRTIATADSPLLRDLGFMSGGADPATAEFGLTSADYALADTGTLVMIAGAANARLISLLPPAHVAVVPANCLLGSLDELCAVVPRPADATSSMVFITGPSRTADIEQILVRGVHGPGEVHVVIIDR